MPLNTTDRTRRRILAALGAAACSLAAQAEEHPRGAAQPLLPRYQAECGSCHLAYPPRMLPAATWQALMGSLQRHFGSDATLDAKTHRELSAWLADNSALGRRASEAPPGNRITRSSWFVREHREVSPATWALPKVGSAARCEACHTHAERGVFDEHDIRIPR